MAQYFNSGTAAQVSFVHKTCISFKGMRRTPFSKEEAPQFRNSPIIIIIILNLKLK